MWDMAPLECCTSYISRQLNNIRVSDIETEFELILARAEMFFSDENLLSTYTVCPKHRVGPGTRARDWLVAVGQREKVSISRTPGKCITGSECKQNPA